MDNIMINRIATAIYTDFGKNKEGLPPFKLLYPSAKKQYIDKAIGIVKIMREPTVTIINTNGPDMPAGGSVAEIWIKCIDAILGDK